MIEPGRSQPWTGTAVTPEGFSGLALRLRGRTGLTQRDLAARLGLHVRSVQLWEAGSSHPNAQRLQALIQVWLDAGAFGDGVEQAEAEAVWNAAIDESSRLKTAFDAAWFVRQLRERNGRVSSAVAAAPRPGGGRQSWGDAPDVAGFLGRADERATLRDWVIDKRSSVVAVLGLGGIGKTMLAARLAHDLTPAFEHVYWRSLRNAPSVGEWLDCGNACPITSTQPLPARTLAWTLPTCTSSEVRWERSS
jgi:transcriptional regulator with XRE-family HTH domain